MKEQEYYNEIEFFIKKNEISKRRRVLEENYDTLNNYWNIGRLLVEAQGGQEKAKYGDELIKKWSKQYTESYGSGYNYTNLSRFRQFYLEFLILAAVRQLSWTNIKMLLPIKDTNKRNYYANLIIEHNLSSRKLSQEIKMNSYERLIDKSEKVELIVPKKEYTILEDMKNPIIIKVDKNKEIKNEKDLEITILSEITFNSIRKRLCFYR